MPRADVRGIELEYESFGRASDPTLLLVMGLGGQMLLWDEELCETFAARGHYVVRFDNRDVGLSTKLDAHGVPNVLAAMQSAASGAPVDAPYTLADMADDAAGLLDALEVERAHVMGASMGGMIAQTLAIRHGDRVRTLTSVMSTTGAPGLPGPKPEALPVLLTPAPTEREAFVAHNVSVWRTIGGPGFAFDEAAVRERAERLFERGVHPAGVARQLAAILASGSRRDALRGIRVPTLVIHGEDDPLVPFEGGRDTADAVPGAELIAVPGMGHDMPRDLWPTLVEAVVKHVARG
jgi:pimeloyl-ACP methyl ester carboxylesterase